jgi:hypothetical protein
VWYGAFDNGALCCTSQEFKECDKKHLLRRNALSLLYELLTKRAVDDPDKLLSFLLLTYADLKVYRFTYWLGVPAFVPDQPFNSSELRCLKDVTLENGSGICLELYRALIQMLVAKPGDSSLQTVFAVRFPAVNESTTQSNAGGDVSIDANEEASGEGAGDMSEYQMQDMQRAELLMLAQAWEVRYSSEVYLVVVDPSASTTAMGWVVRNLLAMLALHHDTKGASTVRIIGLRGGIAKKLVG